MHVAVRQLAKNYGYLWALKETTVEFHSGECVALLGPNGAGKTTFLRLLSTLLQPSTGEIELDGRSLYGSSILRARIGLLAPNEHLYESLTVKENLRLFHSLYGSSKRSADIDGALETVKLADWGHEYVSALSTGMKCRASIAKWLLLEPKLLLLDEPYGVLDGSGIDLLESFLQTVCANGGIVIMATHHVTRVLQLCTRALVLHQGRLIFDEPRQEPWDNFYRVFGEFLPRGEKWIS